MAEVDELRTHLRDMYLRKGYQNVTVEEIERNAYPPHRDSGDVWEYMPSLPMVWDDSFPKTAPSAVRVTLRAEWFQKGFGGSRFVKIWHGYCDETSTVYFAMWPR